MMMTWHKLKRVQSFWPFCQWGFTSSNTHQTNFSKMLKSFQAYCCVIQQQVGLFNEKMWCLKFKSESKNTPRNCIAGMSSSLKTLLISLILATRSWSSLLLLQNILNVCFAVDLVNKRNFVLSWWSTKGFRRTNFHRFYETPHWPYR